MRLIVRGRDDAERFTTPEPYVVVSITDPPPHSTPADLHTDAAEILRHEFHDFNPPRHEPNHPFEGKTILAWSMQPHHAHSIWEFVRRHRDKTILIHCEAGVSRSPSIAYAIADCMGINRATLDTGGQNDTGFEYHNGKRHCYRTMVNRSRA